MTDPRLARFIRFLEDENLVRFDIDGEGERQFENRFLIQKYVFLAKKFGLDLPYDYDIYTCGPYSSALTNTYYSMARSGNVYLLADGSSLGASFDAEGFLKAVRDKDKRWLRAATTLIRCSERYKDRGDLVEITKHIEDDDEDLRVSKTLSDLEALRIL